MESEDLGETTEETACNYGLSPFFEIMFMDRNDILNQYVVTNLPLRVDAIPETTIGDDDDPF